MKAVRHPATLAQRNPAPSSGSIFPRRRLEISHTANCPAQVRVSGYESLLLLFPPLARRGQRPEWGASALVPGRNGKRQICVPKTGLRAVKKGPKVALQAESKTRRTPLLSMMCQKTNGVSVFRQNVISAMQFKYKELVRRQELRSGFKARLTMMCKKTNEVSVLGQNVISSIQFKCKELARRKKSHQESIRRLP
jgi:hypothetical protein